MDIKKYIESGILELYVAGTLSEKENKEVFLNITQYPELLEEVKLIEAKVNSLTAAVSPNDGNYSFKSLLFKIIEDKEDTSKVISIEKKYNWITYSGWAASLLISSFLVFSISKNNQIEDDLVFANNKNSKLETTLATTESQLNKKETILTNIRYKDIVSVPLSGQQVAPESYAKVYWNKDKNVMFVDVQGLPEPPEGKVYQLWSLKLNPLLPTSLGTLDKFTDNSDKIFKVMNPNNSEAFGITLEPAGGSKTPTLEQLYTLGAIKKA